MTTNKTRDPAEKGTISSPDSYRRLIPCPEKALEKAHDLRKFEIELYWKRATYFWTIIALAFVGFFSASNASNLLNSYIISCLGLILSLGLYIVNRASSAVQRNWDLQIRLLEDDVTGPLHKILMCEPRHKAWHLLRPYRYSISKLNAVLSLTIVVVWISLNIRTLLIFVTKGESWLNFAIPLSITIIASVLMLRFAAYDDPLSRKIHGEIITYD